MGQNAEFKKKKNGKSPFSPRSIIEQTSEFFFFFLMMINLVQICSSKLVLSLVPNKIKVDRVGKILTE